MLLRCGMMMSLRQVRKPTMKKRAVATLMARVSVLICGSSAKPGALMLRMGTAKKELLRSEGSRVREQARFKTNCFWWILVESAVQCRVLEAVAECDGLGRWPWDKGLHNNG